jgi:hypothetical protein
LLLLPFARHPATCVCMQASRGIGHGLCSTCGHCIAGPGARSCTPGTTQICNVSNCWLPPRPQVRGSAEAAKRSFLEKKGLKAAEIEEAFRRVPPEPLPPPPAAAHQPGAVTPSLGANNLVTYTQQQQHAAPPGPGAGSAAASPAHHQAMVPAAPLPLVQQQPIRWTQVRGRSGHGVREAGDRRRHGTPCIHSHATPRVPVV